MSVLWRGGPRATTTWLPGACLSIFALSASAAAAPTAEILVEERTPLAFLLVTPSGAASRARSSAVIASVSELLEDHTDFDVQLVDADRVADCGGRLACLVRAVRPDYDRSRLIEPGGRMRPFSDHQAWVQDRRVAVPTVLFVLSSIALPDGDRLIPQWIDTDAALAIDHNADRSGPDWRREVEAQVRERALSTRLPSHLASSEEDAVRFLNGLITRELRSELEARGHWEPFAEVWLVGTPNGVTVGVDGRTVGTTRSDGVRLTQIRPGAHRIELRGPRVEPWSQRLELRAGATEIVEPDVRILKDRHEGRTALLWSGVALGAAGLAVSVFALTESDDTVIYCSDTCGTRFRSLDESRETPRFGSQTGGGGFLTGPLGYSMLLSGGALSLGSLWIGNDDEFPWVALVGGLALGATAYGVSAALDPGPP